MSVLALLVDDVVVKRFELDQPKLTIGRRADCDIMIDDSSVSGMHAELSISASEFFPGVVEVTLTDLQSTNGTFVNDRQIQSQLLSADDEIRIAFTHFKYIDDKQNDAQQTVQIAVE